jgi:hypothetical protein
VRVEQAILSTTVAADDVRLLAAGLADVVAALERVAEAARELTSGVDAQQLQVVQQQLR